jgi:phospholipid N-methyltransferase
MELFKLVKNFNLISNMDIGSMENVHRLMTLATVQINSQYQAEIEKLTVIADTVQSNIVAARNTLDELKNKISAQIDSESEKYCIKDNVIDGVCIAEMQDVKGNRSRTLSLTDESSIHLISKIRELTTTKYPALEIGPGDGQWTRSLIAADPLYLVDLYQEFLDSAAAQFPEDYQRRLRKYQVNAHGVSYTGLGQLPQNQFAFVFSCNVFEYFTLDVFTEYLTSIFKVLRPGGSAIITYNNTEYENNIFYVTLGVRSWMPKTKLIAICKNIGYEIIDTVDYPSSIHWITIKKPGVLNTVKLIQGIGSIVNKNSP